MEPIIEALRLLQRQAEIQNDLRQTRDHPLLAERELFLIRQKLTQFPAAVQGDGQAPWPADLVSGGTARTLAHGRAGRSLAKQGQRSVTVALAANELHRPVDTLSVRDVERCCQ